MTSTSTRCPLTELAESDCAHCKGAEVPQRTRPRDVSTPAQVIVEGNREPRGIAWTWAPYGNGLNKELDPRAGHVHIVGSFTAQHLRKILRACPDVYLVTCAPTQYKAHHHDALLDFVGRGIGFQTMRLMLI